MTTTIELPTGQREGETQSTYAGRAHSSPSTKDLTKPNDGSSAGNQTSASSGHRRCDAQGSPAAAGGANLPTGHGTRETQVISAGRAQTSPSTILRTTPIERSSAGNQTSGSSSGHRPPDTQICCAAATSGANLPTGQDVLDTHVPRAGRAQTSPSTKRPTKPSDHTSTGISTSGSSGQATYDAHSTSATATGTLSSDNGQSQGDTHRLVAVVGPTPPPGQFNPDAQGQRAGRGPFLRDDLLGILADAVDDLERVRTATDNRYRQLTRTETDSDGEDRGFGLDEHLPAVKRLGGVAKGIAALEHEAILAMNAQVRTHPLWKTWAIDQKGIGEKQFARLLAAVGDPYWNDLHDRPRTVSELWAYCGYSVVHPADQGECETQNASVGGVAPKRIKGQKVNWNTDARMRVYLITENVLKAQGEKGALENGASAGIGHLGGIYYARRAKDADAVHHADCVRCGPKGKPALAGSPLSGAHQQGRALRAIAKEILRGMWVAAKELHA